mmetsp:Transcript_20571/g.30507  ORF Transcript_20571/g.30507 Transcript_20571/m.30507 type:complete len:95 (-) Transcript_20571:555-839(-)
MNGAVKEAEQLAVNVVILMVLFRIHFFTTRETTNLDRWMMVSFVFVCWFIRCLLFVHVSSHDMYGGETREYFGKAFMCYSIRHIMMLKMVLGVV